MEEEKESNIRRGRMMRSKSFETQELRDNNILRRPYRRSNNSNACLRRKKIRVIKVVSLPCFSL